MKRLALILVIAWALAGQSAFAKVKRTIRYEECYEVGENTHECLVTVKCKNAALDPLTDPGQNPGQQPTPTPTPSPSLGKAPVDPCQSTYDDPGQNPGQNPEQLPTPTPTPTPSPLLAP